MTLDRSCPEAEAGELANAKPLAAALALRIERLASATQAACGTNQALTDLAYIDPVLAQLALPRRQTDARVFERRSGGATLRLEAGQLWQNGRFELQPLPFGSMARFLLLAIGREAVRTQRPEIQLAASAAAFLRHWGCDGGGDRHRELGSQLRSLAALQVRTGLRTANHDRTLVGGLMDVVDLDLSSGWPSSLRLTPAFFAALKNHGAPVLLTAVRWLRRSPLAMDVFTWSSLRLPQVAPAGTFIPWAQLESQFSEENKRFRRDFEAAIKLVGQVWPRFEFFVSPVELGVFLRRTASPVLPRQRRMRRPSHGG